MSLQAHRTTGRGRKRMPDDLVSAQPRARQNRSAQQAWRDRQKEYTRNLEEEVARLKQELMLATSSSGLSTPFFLQQSQLCISSPDCLNSDSDEVSSANAGSIDSTTAMQLAAENQALTAVNQSLTARLTEVEEQLEVYRVKDFKKEIETHHPTSSNIDDFKILHQWNAWAFTPPQFSLKDPFYFQSAVAMHGPVQFDGLIAQFKSLKSFSGKEYLVDIYFDAGKDLESACTKPSARAFWARATNRQHNLFNACDIVDRTHLFALLTAENCLRNRHEDRVVEIMRVEEELEPVPADESLLSLRRTLKELPSLRPYTYLVDEFGPAPLSRPDYALRFVRNATALKDIFNVCSPSDAIKVQELLELRRLSDREMQDKFFLTVEAKLMSEL
ncbi:hypothetical protein BJ741DRAFT_631633 [Chytriomyces cf. hyalinus JEL632]|nr:hypothetical protein BJ741DRAFT_631633 [Chytriomyces cf. hyalinus JEL632]